MSWPLFVPISAMERKDDLATQSLAPKSLARCFSWRESRCS
jgi:hypothetical protein